MKRITRLDPVAIPQVHLAVPYLIRFRNGSSALLLDKEGMPYECDVDAPASLQVWPANILDPAVRDAMLTLVDIRDRVLFGPDSTPALDPERLSLRVLAGLKAKNPPAVSAFEELQLS